ncbi:hypothetical protein CAPTEDRAFT_208735 [Capitella teleta]|uniref:Uncharacterized protein n=1 Tax=Capitella teleta TaxID=283909 RepID=R7TTG7_CAPTE|nr:hypothetical protein CAPTEDRAFT_208735 [Capitella teleta]|eukprot:ELT94766.1 hypothetical protein CAPTEDRAFT_208735 [Capitella teleta]
MRNMVRVRVRVNEEKREEEVRHEEQEEQEEEEGNATQEEENREEEVRHEEQEEEEGNATQEEENREEEVRHEEQEEEKGNATQEEENREEEIFPKSYCSKSGVSDVLREVQLVIYFYSKKVYAFNCINNRTIDGQGERRITKRIIQSKQHRVCFGNIERKSIAF